MRIRKIKSKNSIHYAIIKDITTINGKRTTCVYENIGNMDKLKQRAGNMDPLEWLDNYVKELNLKNKKETLPVIITKDPTRLIDKNCRYSFNVGYLFLECIYYKLGLNKIASKIEDKYKFQFDFNDILSKLIFSRIIYPASKLKTLELSKSFIEQPNFEYQHIERALPIISKEMDFIQSELYKNTKKYCKRNNRILYYDCTNYYFEIEEEDDFRKYGKSKENRPNPLVQMGLFMDGDAIPLAFNITPGNTNEQETLQPLELKILEDFNLAKFVVCTDAGLASNENRKFNNIEGRFFITTQSLKKMKKHLKEWSLDLTKGWKLPGSDKVYDISKLREEDELMKNFYDDTFYKERWINENGIEQRLIVTYSVKYQEYQRKIREGQIQRALKLIETNPKKIGKAKEKHFEINQDIINQEAMYDGLYAVCTNLEDPVEEIVKVNHSRWEIEESFRIMKSEFKSRPVFHRKEDMIKAHFTTCFLALIVYRYLEKELNQKYTVTEIIDTLKEMNMKLENKDSYIPNYTRTDLTDDLHDKFGFRTDYEVIDIKKFKKIFSQIKK